MNDVKLSLKVLAHLEGRGRNDNAMVTQKNYRNRNYVYVSTILFATDTKTDIGTPRNVTRNDAIVSTLIADVAAHVAHSRTSHRYDDTALNTQTDVKVIVRRVE